MLIPSTYESEEPKAMSATKVTFEVNEVFRHRDINILNLEPLVEPATCLCRLRKRGAENELNGGGATK